MRFDPETDEALFAETRATLLEAFEAWCEAHPGVGAPAPEAAGDVWLALDWKLYYGGGDLSWWRVEHLVEFLLEWCPRKTPAGVRTVRRLLGQAGYEVPEAGRWAEASAAELLSGTDGDDFATMWGELQAWRARRSDEDAVAQLGDAVLALADPALRNLALAAMGDIDTRLAAPHVRRLSAERASRGAALCWLVDHGMESPAALYDPVDPEVFVDVLAQRLVGHGPEAMMATLELAGAHDAQTALIGRLWRCPSQATLGVLTVIGSAHPSKAVAKAARKAVFQRRSSSLG